MGRNFTDSSEARDKNVTLLATLIPLNDSFIVAGVEDKLIYRGVGRRGKEFNTAAAHAKYLL